jgi:SAM-dependent methyltransferase
MSLVRSVIDNLKSLFLSQKPRWEVAQYKEAYYWKNTPAYFMPWLDRLNRFGYRLGDFSQYSRYVDCLPLSSIVSRFDFMALPPRPVVVDLGCGPAGIGYAVRHDGKTYCIDPLLQEYQAIPGYRENVFALLESNKVLVAEGGESASIPEKADLAFCINVLDHTQDPAAVLRNCARLLKEGGYLFLMVDGYLNWSPFIIDPLHPHQFSAPQLKQLLEQSGFSVLHFEEARSPHGGRIPRLMVWLQNWGKRNKAEFGEFFAIARKPESSAQTRVAAASGGALEDHAEFDHSRVSH